MEHSEETLDESETHQAKLQIASIYDDKDKGLG